MQNHKLFIVSIIFFSFQAFGGLGALGQEVNSTIPRDYSCDDEGDNDFQEDRFGPGNLNTVSANGSLAAGFSSKGVLSVLRWPSPSYYDHVNYATPFLFVDACKLRQTKYHGADEDHGSFAGLSIEQKGTRKNKLSWFRDEGWEGDQRYVNEDSNVVYQKLTNKELGLKVVKEDFVHAQLDVLVRRYHITRLKDSPHENFKFVYYENFNPENKKHSMIPMRSAHAQWANDFGLFYYSAKQALIHFRPESGKRRDLKHLASQSQRELDAFIEKELDELYPSSPENIFIAIGLDQEIDEHQVGGQGRFLGRIRRTQNAFYDSLRGDLKGNSFHLGQSTGALGKKLKLRPGETQTVTSYISFGHSNKDALNLLQEAREKGDQRLFSDTQLWWKKWISKAKLPNVKDDKIRKVSKRALINIRNGYDKKTGAVIASLSTQPPYYLVWPRDVAFIAYALNVAGYTQMAQESIEFIVRQQRDCSIRKDWTCKFKGFFKSVFGWDLKGTFAMNYYGDGQEGGPIFFEIDNTGLMAWMMWEHSKFLTDAHKRDDYKRSIYPKLKKSAKSLALCRDDETGLQCRAFEDDVPKLQQNLQGAVSVYAALSTAHQAAIEMNDERGFIDLLGNRKRELKAAIEKHFYQDNLATPHFSGQVGAGAWLIWPAKMYSPHENILCHEARHNLELMKKTLGKKTQGSKYDGKILLSLSSLSEADREHCGIDSEVLGWGVEKLLKEVSDPVTHQFGEAYVTGDINGDGVKEFHNRTSVPHIWAGSLNYLSAFFYYRK